MPSATLSAADQRTALGNLNTLALRDLDASFAPLHDQNIDIMRAALGTQILPALGDRYGGAAASLAADWYDARRDDALVRGAFEAIPAVLPELSRWESLAGWAMSPMFRQIGVKVALPLVVTAVGVGLTRSIMNAHRDTIVQSSQRDPQATGWRRETSGAETCDFCRMLSDRGGVYSKDTVRFAAHDHCDCLAGPTWSGFGRGEHGISVIAYEMSTTRSRSEATKAKDNARAREYMDSHYH